ncbi:MAG TPA: selenium metabolism-associated LysR family transcriptional regulator [Actinomycetota bacterium]|nr:selenium metabolism-associated LysR family transcriptional regulator [Actinomycetota bacterium]
MAPLTIPALRGFVKLVDEGSFSAAAKRLGVTQPAISAQIRTLEDHFGTKLIVRSGRSWIPTAAGEQLYQHAGELATAAERLEESMSTFGTLPAGRLNIGASTVPGEFLLPKILSPFCERFPAVRVCVQVGDTAHIADQLLLRRVDMAVIGAAVAVDRLELIPFATDELVLIASSQNELHEKKPIHRDDLIFHPWVLRERGSGTRTMVSEAMAAVGLDPERLGVVLELGTTESVKRAVKANVGLSFISTYALEPGETSGDGELRVLNVPGLKAQRTLYLAVERGRTRRNSVDELLSFLTSKEVAAELKKLKFKPSKSS